MKKKKYNRPEIETSFISSIQPMAISNITINEDDYTDDSEPNEVKEFADDWGSLWN